MGDVVAQQFEPLVIEQMFDIASSPGEEVVDAEDLAASFQQLLAEVRAQKAGASGD
jgi:hypothetical protein